MGLSTSSFQKGGASGLSTAYGGGANGLYPYLNSFYPAGVQAISGVAYKDAGVSPLTSGVRQPFGYPDPGYVSAASGGTALGKVTTGYNGYYYIALPNGTLGNGASVVSYTQADPNGSGARNAATVATSTGGTTLANVDVLGGTITQATSATSVSAALSLADSRTAANTAAGNVANATTTINAINGLGFVTSGASFNVDTVSGLDTLYVRTGAGAPITVSTTVNLANTGGGLGLFSGDAITVSAPVTLGGGGLALNAGTSLAVNAPVNLNGAVAASLAADFDTTTVPGISLLNLSFGPGASIDYGATNNGGTLAINGQSYGLLYSMGDVAGLNNVGGTYALATNLDATNNAYGSAVIGTFTGTLEGLGHTVSNLTITGSSNNAGLIGTLQNGTVRDIGLINASVSGATNVGGLVGFNLSNSNVLQSYVTGSVSGNTSVGGLVGRNDTNGNVVKSYASSSVTGAPNNNYVGGLVGYNSGSSVVQSYATGSVSGSDLVGGLVGLNVGFVAQSYATGRVSGSTNLGGLVGFNFSGTIAQSYWDMQTSGRSNGVGANPLGSSVSVTGLTTRQLQGLDPVNGNAFSVASNLGNGTTSAFAGGASGLYPYLASFFPNGVQVISGYSYADAGLTPSTPRTIGVIGGGVPFATAFSGANGYYYAFGQNGTIATNATLLVNNGVNAATLTSKNGATIQSVNLYGNALTIPTTAISLSTAPSLADARTTATAAAGGNAAAQTAISGATGRGFFATDSAGFLIDQSISSANTFYVQTTAANAGITVSQPITIDSGGSLGLLAAGTFTVNAPVTAPKLLLTGVGGAFTLTGSNAIDELAANTGRANVKSNNPLTVSAGIANAASVTTSGVTTSGNASVASTGDLTIATGSRVLGANSVFAAGGAFINNAGANAVTATSGRWLVYSADPAANAYGALDSGSTAVWNTAAGASVNVAGNRYVFAAPRTLTVTSTSDSKTYGDDITARVATHSTIAGFDAGLAGLYLADTAATAFTGAANVTSAGAAATANVAGSPYIVTASLGSLASSSGYGFGFVNAGLLTVSTRSISVTANTQSRIFGDANPALTDSIGGFGLVNGDTLAGGLATTATSASNAGFYGITQGTLAATANYSPSYQGAILSVLPAPPVVTPATPTQTKTPVFDVALLASIFIGDGANAIALPNNASPILGAPTITTTLGTGVFYADPRFESILVCFGGGGGRAASCYAVRG